MYNSNTFKQLWIEVFVEIVTIIILAYIFFNLNQNLVFALAAIFLSTKIFLSFWTFRQYKIDDNIIQIKNRIVGNEYQIEYDQIKSVSVRRIFPGSIWPSWLMGWHPWDPKTWTCANVMMPLPSVRSSIMKTWVFVHEAKGAGWSRTGRPKSRVPLLLTQAEVCCPRGIP